MEISRLKRIKGNIIGIISSDFTEEFKTDDFIIKDKISNPEKVLKMVLLEESILRMNYKELSNGEKNKINLALQLKESVIVLENFYKGLTKKELQYFKQLFKKLNKEYGKKIILITDDAEILLNNIDAIYVVKGIVIYNSDNLFDKELYKYIKSPKLVDFYFKCEEKNIKLEKTTEFNDLLKIIYRSIT